MVASVWGSTEVEKVPAKKSSVSQNVCEVVINKTEPNPANNEAANVVVTSPSKNKKGKNSFFRKAALFKSPFKFLGGIGKTYCQGCHKKCCGEVLRVNEVFFHTDCFRCSSCTNGLIQGGFFTHSGVDSHEEYYCPKCYQSKYGTKCSNCSEFVEGEVVTALGKTYHQNCFRCAKCNNTFPTGERVTFSGNKCFCQTCSPSKSNAAATLPRGATANCAGCNQELLFGQALLALNKQYHVWCFKCQSCKMLLHGEYMGGADGLPYCERCYQANFGVKCTYCFRFISGKVLQAGDQNHFHPTCARCTKCGEPFGDGEEMFLQGAAIWHPRCGPGPSKPYTTLTSPGLRMVNGYQGRNRNETLVSLSPPDPGNNFRHYRRGLETEDQRSVFSRSTTQMATGSCLIPDTSMENPRPLYSSSSTYSLKRPLEPGDRQYSSMSQHFHLPSSRFRQTSSAFSSTRQSMESLVNARGGVYSSMSHGRRDSVSAPLRPNSAPPVKPNGLDKDYKIYPMHMLFTSNFKIPPDCDRCNLEMHLDDEDFSMAFGMSRQEFRAMPLWRRNELKRRVKLF